MVLPKLTTKKVAAKGGKDHPIGIYSLLKIKVQLIVALTHLQVEIVTTSLARWSLPESLFYIHDNNKNEIT